MERIKILMVLISTGMGGAENFALNVVRNIDRKKFQVDFAVTTYKESDIIYQECKKCGCNFFVLPRFLIYNYFWYVKSWRTFLSKHPYDIVYGHTTGSASIYLGVAKECGIKTIAHCHSAGFRGNWLHQFAKWIFTRNINNVSDYKFACSDKAAKHLYGKDFKKNSYYYNIPNAIDVNKYIFNTEIRKRIRSKYTIDERTFVCGHIGSFSPVKNHKFLLEIFQEVLKHRPNSKLLCCGGGVLLSDIRAKASQMGIAEKVIFAGIVSNPHEYMMAMDCFIFPSFFEGFPISALEAQATGLPLVMNDVISKEVDLAPIILRTDLSQPASYWAELVLSVHSENREHYNEIIANTKYNIKKSVQEFEQLYVALVKE